MVPPRYCIVEGVVEKEFSVDVMSLTKEVVVLLLLVVVVVIRGVVVKSCRVVSRVFWSADVFGVDIEFDEVCVRGKEVARLTSVAANKTAGIINRSFFFWNGGFNGFRVGSGELAGLSWGTLSFILTGLTFVGAGCDRFNFG